MRSFVLFPLSAMTLIVSPLFADEIILDDVMDKEEQKKTGVINLSVHQKIELENWINRTFVLKNPAAVPQGQLSMSININNGQKLQLSDGSIWEIAPDDVQTAALWITPFPVEILRGSDPKYPSVIVNTNSGISVKAKKTSS